MITTVTLSRGAIRMAGRKVIVKRLASIHDLGAMTVLCTDKTGTLTSAEIRLHGAVGPAGEPAPDVASLAALCADLGGDRGALDAALLQAGPDAAKGWVLLARQAFDFRRRIGSVAASGPTSSQLVVKGAPEAVVALCSTMRRGADAVSMTDQDRTAALAAVEVFARQGLRTIAVATKPWPREAVAIAEGDEADLVYEGLCTFADPPKPTAAAALARLAAAGVRVKILSGDDPIVVASLAAQVGLKTDVVLRGTDLDAIGSAALGVQAQSVDVYGRLTPDEKVRVIHALQARGEVVGYLGDGVNDGPGLKAADIGLSVEGASGVATAAADMILLASDLDVVAEGVEEGRRTFVNILKYVRMGASSNFGNMLSMAIASFFLPFLPMLATQVLLNNLLYDVSELGIPFDRVAKEALAKPQHWDLRRLMKFALVMGPLSSIFDLLTFAVLLTVFHTSAAGFRTAWFMESIATQILVIFIIRTRGWPWRSRPDRVLTATSLGALAVALVLPFTPLGGWFGFQPLAPALLAALAGLVAAYLVSAEALKRLAMGEGPVRPAAVRAA